MRVPRGDRSAQQLIAGSASNGASHREGNAGERVVGIGLTDARDRCPHLDTLARHVTDFAVMLIGLHGERLDDWLTAVEHDPDQPDLRSFAAGIRRDYDAVGAGLTLTHNSGAVEGNVNRIKMIKRQMYGRASFDLRLADTADRV